MEKGKQGKPLRKKSALPPQHSDSSPPLKEDERAAASGQGGAGISAAACEALTRTTARSRCEGQGDISVLLPTRRTETPPRLQSKESKERAVGFKWTVQSKLSCPVQIHHGRI